MEKGTNVVASLDTTGYHTFYIMELHKSFRIKTSFKNKKEVAAIELDPLGFCIYSRFSVNSNAIMFQCTSLVFSGTSPANEGFAGKAKRY